MKFVRVQKGTVIFIPHSWGDQRERNPQKHLAGEKAHQLIKNIQKLGGKKKKK